MLHRGKLTKLTPTIQKAIVTAVAAGIPLASAAQLAGIDPKTVSEWMLRGQGLHVRCQTKLYAEFAEAIIRARAQDEARRVARIEQAGRGGAVVYRKTTTMAGGRTVTEERFTPPDWSADAFHLERTRHESWGRKDKLDVTVQIQALAAKVAQEMGLTVEEVLAEAQALLTEAGPQA